LDLIELILALPSLPGTYHHHDHHHRNHQEHQSIDDTTTPLANRAKLRLLEDAMLDECEKEGEGELIQELTIKPEDDQTHAQQVQHNKKKLKSKK
jgi:hypothetical protein